MQIGISGGGKMVFFNLLSMFPCTHLFVLFLTDDSHTQSYRILFVSCDTCVCVEVREREGRLLVFVLGVL